LELRPELPRLGGSGIRGSAMMTAMICLGILMSIDRTTRRDSRRGRL
jgi:hypothetical protein